MPYNQYAGKNIRPAWYKQPQPKNNAQFTQSQIAKPMAANNAIQKRVAGKDYQVGGQGVYTPNLPQPRSWNTGSEVNFGILPGAPSYPSSGGGLGSATYKPGYQAAPPTGFSEDDYRNIMGSGLKTAQNIMNDIIGREYNYPEWWGDKAKAPQTFNFYDFVKGPQYQGIKLPGEYKGGIDKGTYNNIQRIAGDLGLKIDPRYGFQTTPKGVWNSLNAQNQGLTYDETQTPGDYTGGVDSSMWGALSKKLGDLDFNIDSDYQWQDIGGDRWGDLSNANRGLGYDKINLPGSYNRLMGGDYNRLENALRDPAQRAATNAYEQGKTYLDDVMSGQGMYGSSVMTKQAIEGLNKRYMDTMSDAASRAVAQRYGMQQGDEQFYANNALQRAQLASGENRADLAARQGMYNNAANLLGMQMSENIARGNYGLGVAQGNLQANNSFTNALQNMINTKLSDTQFGANYGMQQAEFTARENLADLNARQNMFRNSIGLTDMRQRENQLRSQYGMDLAKGNLQSDISRLGAFQDLLRTNLQDAQFGAGYGLQRSQLERQNLMDRYQTQYSDTLRRQNYLRDQLGWNQGQSEAQRNFYNQMLQGGYQHQLGQDAWRRGIDMDNYNMAMNLMGSTMPLYSNAQQYNRYQDAQDAQDTSNLWGTIGNIASFPIGGDSTIGGELIGGAWDWLTSYFGKGRP